MPKKMKAPCIRGLKRYEKTGCPGSPWDPIMQTGCPAWTTVTTPDPSDAGRKEIRSDCIDQWNMRFQYETVAMLEGVQRAVENFRNGMVEINSTGDSSPKVNRSIKNLVNIVERKLLR